MKKKIYLFVFMLVIIILLFSILYLIGILNYIESDLIKKIPLLDFTSFGLGKSLVIIYLVALTIALLVIISIITAIIVSFKEEKIGLTSLNIDEFSIQKEANQGISNSFDKLVSSLNKNIEAIQKYTEVIDSDVERIDKIKLENTIREKIESLYQDFSHMINDMINVTTVSELFEKILFWGVSFSNSKRGSLMVVDKNKELYIYKTIGWKEEEENNIASIRIPLGEGIAGKVASENKRIFITDLEDYEQHDFKYKENYQTKSFISMPIFGVKKVVAVLNLTENKSGLLDINDLEIINVITKLSSKIFELIQMKKKIY
ncbi:MAG: GAF domain-containing protein [Candidatus Lokiarchaeota archaeon]|nr:GAF domain-containing protein [Candidatus Lokiarchaeota archaeon]